ncbi:UDP-glucose 6-dehydrogenase 2-like [Chenopodium quinoa]|uniref:UDP-glucose 6-dehydrogenase 2-like n=1 Tax=Chenopodium quinoa TaxID=63459 RepID=UPI000B76CC0D|nr:UDP-glucose 6-dehydrogenase 2-like [Chenopodium quinoa]
MVTSIEDYLNNVVKVTVPDIDELTRICCIGSGPFGVLTTHVLADRFPLKRFILIDVNDTLIIQYQNAVAAIGGVGAFNLPIQEPQFDQLFTAIHTAPNPNVLFRTAPHHATNIIQAQVIIICAELDLEKKTRRIRALANIDLSDWEKAVNLVRRHAISRKLVIDFSPFPPLDGNKLGDVMGNHLQHILVSNPQFFSLGTAISDLTNPTRVVLALKFNHPFGYLNLVRLFYHQMGQGIILNAKFRAAEFGRLAANCCLGIMAIFSNMMTKVGNQIEVHIENVMRVITTDVRIGNRFLDPYTAGWGPNLLRDLNVLQFIAHHYNLDDHARFIRYAIAANEERMTCHIRKMKTSMISFKGKTLAIFRIAFKEGTSDIKYSTAVSMCKKLVKYGCNLRIYDPLVPKAIIRGVFPIVNRVTIMGKTQADMLNTCQGTHALCFFTRSAKFQIPTDGLGSSSSLNGSGYTSFHV